MRRILSIFFLAVFLFQVGGYYIVFVGLQHHAKLNLTHRLDAGKYTQQELVFITIPLTLPYPMHDDSFQRVDGEFEYEGETYKLVKQKYENDTIFLACIKDAETSRISAALSDFTKFSHSLPVDSKKMASFFSKLYQDYKSTEFRMLYKSRIMYEQTYFAHSTAIVAAPSISLDSPPPELLF